RAEAFLQDRGEIVAHEVAVNLPGNEVRGDLLIEDDVENVDAVEVAALAEEFLLAGIVFRLVELEAKIVVGPAGERSRRLADVVLAVVAHPHGEEFHDLAAEVLVRGALYVLPGGEKNQHGRVLGHGDQKLAEISSAFLMEQLELDQHFAIVADLVGAGGEMSVPEQRHLLLQGTI